jgi:hypothetical protein
MARITDHGHTKRSQPHTHLGAGLDDPSVAAGAATAAASAPVTPLVLCAPPVIRKQYAAVKPYNQKTVCGSQAL